MIRLFYHFSDRLVQQVALDGGGIMVHTVCTIPQRKGQIVIKGTPSPAEMLRDMEAFRAGPTAPPAAQQVATVPPIPPLVDAKSGFSFSELASAAVHVAQGFDVADQANLEGIPFAVVEITIRDGVPRDGKPTNYASLCVVTADVATLTHRIRSGFLKADWPLSPNTTYVINDGSTGLYRQTIAFLQDIKLIDIGPIGKETGGELGQSPYDRPRDEWVRGKEEAEAGFHGRPLWLCPRGLRRSEYTNEKTGSNGATTWYIA